MSREKTGLPLRAMVMVLLFLGVIFLLAAIQAMHSGNGDGSSGPSKSASAPATSALPSTPAAPVKSEVAVYNISTVAGLAGKTADKLKAAGWVVPVVDNLDTVLGVNVTTVYYDPANPGEKESAEEVGKVLDAPVAERIPALKNKPVGVIVLATS